MDKTEDGIRVGSMELKEKIKSLKNLKLHVFGHIHAAWGREEHYDTIHVNCAKGYHWLSENKPAITVSI